MPLMEVPFGTSIVLALGSPEVEAAQPRALVGGHLVTRVVGLMVLTLAARSLGRRRSRSAQSRAAGLRDVWHLVAVRRFNWPTRWW